MVSISTIGGLVGIGGAASYRAFGVHAGKAACGECQAYFTAGHKSEQQCSVAAVKWIVLSIIAVWLLAGVVVLSLRFLRERQGRRKCTEWFCPQCHHPFGGTFREWRRRQNIAIRTALFTGPVLHCSHCNRDFWFTWSGHHLPTDQMTHAFEIVQQSVS